LTDIDADAWVSSTHRPMGFVEFVVIIALIMALNPLATDMMLPALPDIASAFHILAGIGRRRCCRPSWPASASVSSPWAPCRTDLAADRCCWAA
jgi:hypothetical protein